MGVYSNENSPFAIKRPAPNKPRLLAEKGGRIFARVRYNAISSHESRLAALTRDTKERGLETKFLRNFCVKHSAL